MLSEPMLEKIAVDAFNDELEKVAISFGRFVSAAVKRAASNPNNRAMEDLIPFRRMQETARGRKMLSKMLVSKKTFEIGSSEHNLLMSEIAEWQKLVPNLNRAARKHL